MRRGPERVSSAREKEQLRCRKEHDESDHKGEDMKGRGKQAVGDLTGDKDLKREGKRDQASAATKKAIDSIADKAKGMIDPKK